MTQLSDLLRRADQAMLEGEWEKAQLLYQEARNLDPHNTDAERGLCNVRKLIDKAADIEKRMADAEASFTQGDYRSAELEYIGIIDYAVSSPRILRFHPVLEQKRSQVKGLRIWQERVRKTLQDVQQLHEQEKWEAAAKILEGMLRQVPQNADYQPLKNELESAYTTILIQRDHEALMRQAEQLLRAKDYEQSIILLENISPDSPLFASVQQWLNQARSALAAQRDDLAMVEIALGETRWADALAMLEQLRERYQNVSLWQQLYLQAGIAYGRALLEDARQLETRRDFDSSRRQFERAQATFEKVLEVYPTHLDAQALRSECSDLAAIATLQTQAQLDWDNGQRAEAARALTKAQQRLKFAKSEGRDYTAVGAIVEAMHSTVQAEIDRIREEEHRLQDAENLLAKSRLGEAQRLFMETLDALLPEHQQYAADGLRRVEAKIRQFEALMARGHAAGDPIAVVDAYQDAYDLWPEASDNVSLLLEEALVKACEHELNAGRLAAAAAYINRALLLNPDNHAASSYAAKIGVKPQVEATLQRVRNEWESLQRKGIIEPTALEPLIQGLENVLRKVAEWPDLREALAALHQTLREAHTAWQEYEQAYARAAESRGQGDWAAAVTALDQAIQGMGAAAPAGAQRQLTAWRDIAQKLAETRDSAQAALEQVQAAYIAAAARPLGEMTDALDEAVRRHAEPARQRLEETAAQATQAGGAWPADLVTLQKQLQGLAERATAAANATRTPAAAEGLLKIQEVIQLRGSDPTLEAVRAQLEERAREKITNTKIEAQTAIQAGDLAEAEEKLRLVRDLDPNDQKTAQLYAGIRQRRTIEEQLRTLEREAEAKQAGSPVDAMKTWRRGLNLLLEPDVPLPAQVREILNTLMALGDRNDGLALGQADNWQTAQDRLAELGQLRQESWAAGRAQFFADQWIRLARDNALRGVIASEAQLGHLLEAYRAAAEYIKGHPRDPEAIQQLTERTEALINRANEAANKRVQRARSALAKGEFAVALSNLQDIEREFYQPIEQEFPDLLKDQPSVQEMRDTIAQLQAQAQRLQTLHNQASPEIEKARQAYLNNEWDAAEKVLATLLSLQGLPDMEAEVKRLREQIAQARIAATRKRLHDTLSQIETGYHLATTVEQLSAYLERLEELAKEIHLQVLDGNERQRYFSLLSTVRDQREALKASEVWEQQIETCLQKRDYIGALKAIEETLKTVPDDHKRLQLAMRRDEIARLAAEGQEREAALRAGYDAFAEEKYTGARLYFEKAKRLGAEVTELIRAARAGAKLQSARRWWDEDHDADRALADLDDVDRFAEHNPLAKDIAEDASGLRRHIENVQKASALLGAAARETALCNRRIQEAQALRTQWEDPDYLCNQACDADLEKICELVSLVLHMPGYEHDTQAQALWDWVEQERSFDGQVRRFFIQARYDIQTLTHDTWLLSPQGNEHPQRYYGEIYLRLLAGKIPTGDDLSVVHNAIRNRCGTSNTDADIAHCVAIIVSDRASESSVGLRFHEILQESGLRIVTLDSACFKQVRPEHTANDILASAIKLATGQEDLYDRNSPVSDDLSFFGREEVLQELIDRLDAGQMVGLFGLRKVGKTSLLHRLQRRLASRRAIAMVDMQETARESGVWPLYINIVGMFADKVSKLRPNITLPSLHLYPFQGEITPEVAIFFLDDLTALYMALGTSSEHNHLLLIIDEIERLLPAEDNSGYAGYSTLLGQLRAAHQHRQILDVLVVGVNAFVNRSERWNTQENEFYRALSEIWMPPMGRTDIAQMITSLGSQMGVKYTPDALNILIVAGGGHPLITRQLCSRAITGRLGHGSITVTPAEASAAVEDFVSHDEYLSELWYKMLKEEQREILQTLAQSVEPVPRAQLLPDKQRQAALSNLVALENYTLVRRDGENYSIEWDIFRQWIRWSELGLED